MRLGGPVFEKCKTPGMWVRALRKAGYRAAFCPLGPESDRAEIAEYAAAAEQAGIVIAEVGAWSNPLSSDKTERERAMVKCKAGLLLAERIGARCCVNISGSRGRKWDGPDKRNLTAGTFDLVVESVREIIDEVKPARTFYTLETMPWMYPDSVESYRSLLRAIDRRAFAVHFDPVNLVNSPDIYFANGLLIKDFVERLGPHIRSCHAKDILLRGTLTVHLDEVRPGLGGLDYNTFLKGLNRLDGQVSLMLEHLAAEDYRPAAEHIRSVAQQEGISL